MHLKLQFLFCFTGNLSNHVFKKTYSRIETRNICGFFHCFATRTYLDFGMILRGFHAFYFIPCELDRSLVFPIDLAKKTKKRKSETREVCPSLFSLSAINFIFVPFSVSKPGAILPSRVSVQVPSPVIVGKKRKRKLQK